MKKLLLIPLFIFCAIQLFAQEKTITGKITDGDTGEPLPGVNVVVDGTQQGTVTDIDGNYSIPVPSDQASLVFSFIGYNSETVAVAGQSVINIKLIPELQALDEVVVVGYGTMKKSDLTGAVSSIREEDIKSVKASNAVEALQGKIAGVDMTRSSGRAGSGYNILIRGERSFSAENDPIYIVDGIDYGSNININPNDIASMEVLKDASSTAIYGSRGANGVILITTKKGQQGKATISFNTYYGYTTPLGKLKMGTREDYLQITRDLYRTNNPTYWDTADSRINVTSLLYPEEIEGLNNGTDFDWIDAQMKDHGSQQDYHLSITGGSEKTTYAVSINHFVEDNFVPNDYYKRYSIKANVDSKVNKYFEMGNSTFLSHSIQNQGQGINYNMIPLVSAYDSLGNLIPVPNSRVPFSNPLIDQDPDYRTNEVYQTDVFSTFYGQLNIMPGLTFRSSFNLDLGFNRTGNFSDDYPGLARQSTASVSLLNEYKWTLINQINFDKTVNEHHIMTTVATETMLSRQERYYQSGQDLALSDFKWYALRTSAAANLSIRDPNTDHLPFRKNSQVSFLGRLHYGYKGKYLATFTGRYDGASQLREKWDFFPSASIAWRLSEESFMQNLNAISNLKLRLGYGVTGNQSVRPYSSLGGISEYSMYYEFGTTETEILGFRTARLETSPRWESTAVTNLGLDFGLVDNKISGTIELYQSKTTDILQYVTLPPTSAVTLVTENIGETQGKGIEFTLRTVNVSTRDFKWTTDFTFASSTEEITFLAGGISQDIANRWFVGQPLSVHYDWDMIGIWQTDEAEEAAVYDAEPGDLKIADVDTVTGIGEGDRMVLGTPRPKWTGGLNSTMTYKGFDLNIFVYARIGQMISDATEVMWSPDGRENSIVRDYWTPNNPSNEYPRLNPDLTRSGWSRQTVLRYTDGSFVKIKDITLGYTLPRELTNKIMISSARVYVTAKNAIVFSKVFKKGRYDPEGVNSNGDLGTGLPIPKMYAVGLNITF
ncbi:MAG: TonB-dependent receptor [Bacteroidales bacterium]|nr:TonB-dependent receptor [Bacteroidales bacterium]